jgi:hypothetical protein
MSKQEEAGLIIKLYDLRREEVMRKARTWHILEFHPESGADVMAGMMGENSAYIRMVVSYWDMACSFVVNGAIDAQMFNDANQEHIATYSKYAHIIDDVRETTGSPTFMSHVEKVVMSIPNVEERLGIMRERFKQFGAMRREAETKAKAAS